MLGYSNVPIKPLEPKDKNGYCLTEIIHRVIGGLIERDRETEEGISGAGGSRKTWSVSQRLSNVP